MNFEHVTSTALVNHAFKKDCFIFIFYFFFFFYMKRREEKMVPD